MMLVLDKTVDTKEAIVIWKESDSLIWMIIKN